MQIIPFPVCYGTTNSYIVCDTGQKKCAVIDPGGDAAKIAGAINETGCEPVAILLTHGHYDHTGAVNELKAIWDNIPVYMNDKDIYKDATDPLTKRLYPEICKTVNYDDGDKVAVGNIEFSVLATPGHTEGGVTLLAEDALFSGDTIFAGSIGRFDLPGGNEEKVMQSLKKLCSLTEDGKDYRVFPGHMSATTLQKELATNPFFLRLCNYPDM